MTGQHICTSNVHVLCMCIVFALCIQGHTVVCALGIAERGRKYTKYHVE